MENLKALTDDQLNTLSEKYRYRSAEPLTCLFVTFVGAINPFSLYLSHCLENPYIGSIVGAGAMFALTAKALVSHGDYDKSQKVSGEINRRYDAEKVSYKAEQTEVQKRYAKIFDTPPEPTIAEINADLEKRRLRNYVKPEIASNIPSNGSEKDMELWFIGELVSKGHKARHQPTPAGKAGRPDVKITLDCGKEWQIELKTNSGNLSDKQKGYATCLKDMGKNWSCLYGTHQMKRWLDSNA